MLTITLPAIAGPLPRFDGIVVDNTTAPPESGAASPPAPSPPPGAGPPIRVPPLQPEDAHKFLSLFEKSDTANGMISGMNTLLELQVRVFALRY
jgi:epidermal growth factor receptor substrate 15